MGARDSDSSGACSPTPHYGMADKRDVNCNGEKYELKFNKDNNNNSEYYY